MPDRLILRSLNSPYGDNTLGSVLSHADVDNNFIYLKGEIIYSAITGNGIVRLLKYNGNEVTFPLSGATIFYTNLTPTDVTIGGIEVLLVLCRCKKCGTGFYIRISSQLLHHF